MEAIALTIPLTNANARAARVRSSIRSSGRTRATVWLTLAFWVSNFLIASLASVLAEGELLFPVAAMRVALVLFGMALCLGYYMLLQAMPVRGFKGRALAAAILAPVTAEIYAWIVYFGSVAVDPDFPAGTWSQAITVVAYWTWFFLAWAALTLALDYSFEMREEQERSAELRALAHAAKLQALQNQVNPHFLFNSLNSMSALLMDERVAAADDMIRKLAGFLRMTLAADPLRDGSLGDELALQRAYLEIEQIRYPDMVIAIELPERLRDACIPELLLQPIVENAVKHGVGQRMPPARISIRVAEVCDRLGIEVDNSSAATAKLSAESGIGLGLRNVRERLQHRFGGEASLSARPVPPAGFRVEIEMPLVMR